MQASLNSFLCKETALVQEAAIWHVAMKDEQLGPITVGRVIGYLRDGLLNADDFAWRPGFNDWKAIGEIEEFWQPPSIAVHLNETEAAEEAGSDYREYWSAWKRANIRLRIAVLAGAIGLGAISVGLVVRDDDVPSKNGPMSGFTRADFTVNFQHNCIQRQRSLAQRQNAGGTDLQISKYCDCVAEKMADGITLKQLGVQQAAENAGALCR